MSTTLKYMNRTRIGHTRRIHTTDPSMVQKMVIATMTNIGGMRKIIILTAIRISTIAIQRTTTTICGNSSLPILFLPLSGHSINDGVQGVHHTRMI